MTMALLRRHQLAWLGRREPTSGLDYVRRGSSVDLWLAVADTKQANAVTGCMQFFSCEMLRLDGELMSSDGCAVAWREWQTWRSDRVEALRAQVHRRQRADAVTGLAAHGSDGEGRVMRGAS